MKLPNKVVGRVVQDFNEAELGDPRRTRRLARVVAKLARAPQATLPDAMGGEAELEAAYRLINNPAVTFTVLGGTHAEATRRRAEQAGQVLVIHDTTECEFSHGDPEQVGYLPTGKPGFLFHGSLVVDQNYWRRPLGMIQGEVVVRAQRSGRGSRKRKVSARESAKWQDREFMRWWRGVESTIARLKNCESVLHLIDREGDSYELLGRMVQNKARFVVRVRCDRRAREPDSVQEQWSSLKELVQCAQGVLEREVPLATRKSRRAPVANRSHPPRKARIAKLHFAATTVEVGRPSYVDKSLPPTLRLNVVHVLEPNPPPEQEPVEWLLYTTEPIDTPEEIAAVVDWYRSRWLIEEFWKALKTGCSYEQRQFESRDALLTLLALCLPIACELLALRSRARSEPPAPATEVLTPLQIKILVTLSPRNPSACSSVREALLAVAALGGHQRNNGEPGWLVLYKGMRKLLDYEVGWRALASRRGDL